MKNTFFITMLCILLGLSLSAQQNSDHFYYYKGEKIFLQQITDKLFIKFEPNTNKEQILMLIYSDTSLFISSINLDNNVFCYATIETKDGKAISPATIEYFKAIPEVVSANVLVQYKGASQGIMDEFVIKLKPATTFAQLQKLSKQNNCNIGEENKYVKNQFMLHVSKTSNLDALQMSNLFYETGLFEFSEPNFCVFNVLHSHDPYFEYQWNLKNIEQGGCTMGIDIKAEQAWTITEGSSDIRIALVDDGVDLEHPDLEDNLLPGYDVTGNNTGGAHLTNAQGHGTACAGIIGAIKDNEIGIAGVAPNCKIIPIHAPLNAGAWTPQMLTDAISCAWKNGADVISNSWGFATPYTPLTNAIDSAVSYGRGGKGCVVVFASGNYDEGEPKNVRYPANLSNVIAVGAISCFGLRLGPETIIDIAYTEPQDPIGVSHNAGYLLGSCYGPELDVMAPGLNITTTDRRGSLGYAPGDYYPLFGFTSAACPHVAGIAALILSVNPDLTQDQVRHIIESTCTKLPGDGYNTIYTYNTTINRPNGTWSNQMGHGLVNAHAAVLAAQCYIPGLPVMHGAIPANTTWNTPVQAVQIDIPNGVTLTITSQVKCGIGTTFTVHPGGKLIIDGGTLTNACPDEMWQGIYVAGNAHLSQIPQNQGILELKNGAVIKNARKAIANYKLASNGTIDYATTGGMIRADNAIFINNSKSVEFATYPTAKSISYFDNCTFVVDNNHLFANNNTNFLSHITMQKVFGVLIRGCTFENNISNMPNRRQAIYTLDAGYTVDQYCASYYPEQLCQCKKTPVRSVFKGFNRAIESLNSTTQYAITIDRSEFENNTTGVHLSGINNPQISRLNMSLSTTYSNSPIGIYLNQCTGYTIEGNEIYSNGTDLSTGIEIHSAGKDENRIYRNQIFNTRYGIAVTESNPFSMWLSFPLTGLQFICNDLFDNKYDIDVRYAAIIRAVQGTTGAGADNRFSKSGIYYYNFSTYANWPVSYYRDPLIPRKDPNPKTNNISVFTVRMANPCSSSLCIPIPSKSTGSLLAEYRELNQTYAEMLGNFRDRGYDEILNNPSAETSGSGTSLAEAITYRNEILTLTEQMAEISKKALFSLKTDSLIDLTQIRDWYNEIYTLSAKYSLAETYYQLGRYEEGFNTLRLIPTMFNLNENEIIEHRNYVSLFTFKNEIRESGRTIAQLTEAEIERMLYFADASYGLSSLMARNILCFFYEICLEEEEAAATGNTGEMARGDDITDPRESVSSASSAFQKPALENITLHPNPTTGELTITNRSHVSGKLSEANNGLQITNIEIFDVYGKKISSNHPITSSSNQKINISHINSGIYFVKITTDAGEVVKKIIKQ